MRKAQNFLKGLKGGLSLHHGGLHHGTCLRGTPRSGERNTWLTSTATKGAPLLWLPVGHSGHCQWHQEGRHSPGRVHEMACRMSMGWQPRIACPRGLAEYPVTLTLDSRVLSDSSAQRVVSRSGLLRTPESGVSTFDPSRDLGWPNWPNREACPWVSKQTH